MRTRLESSVVTPTTDRQADPLLTAQRVRRHAWRVAARARARWQGRPSATRGWITGPPAFVGVGAQRAGTSWWFSLLERHPAVHGLGSINKELHFFDEHWRGSFGDDDVAAYHQLFRRPPGLVCGEWTPRYMLDPWTPRLLRAAAPDTRLLVLLRDPVNRFLSGVTHTAERGRPVDADAIADAIARGRYHEQLSRLLDHFDREQLLVLQLEACRADTDRLLRRTVEFIGLDADRLPPLDHGRPKN
jgi:hypothetical protein